MRKSEVFFIAKLKKKLHVGVFKMIFPMFIFFSPCKVVELGRVYQAGFFLDPTILDSVL